MTECLNCGKPIEQEDKTRREKKYCNDTCRAAFHQKKNAGKKKYVRIETFEQLKEQLDKAKEENNRLKSSKETQGGNKNQKEYSDKGNKKDTPETPKNEFGFDVNDKWFFVEKYTKHPQKDIPLNKIDAQRWLREKTYSDNEIKKAWNEWKKKVNLKMAMKM
jgi:hypothetical protein